MITHVYFVRHAQLNHLWEDDRSRPLTDERTQDHKEIWYFQNILLSITGRRNKRRGWGPSLSRFEAHLAARKRIEYHDAYSQAVEYGAGQDS